ncbi:interleukin-11 receptor subunit alpha [Spea bombifrons]|uniref:interleukin-11 receptor subunit alpha n=1 Tax=Spea bombifrons TaxID=233779 RepID=UPI00234AE880|nr:interleukin-11 receptor subunit alpha [Spea bombifrons]XP_053304713.1 interleukin-11 receptor subunit alpha [Spea bombifrons]
MRSLASCLSRVMVTLALIAVTSTSTKWVEDGVEYGRIGGSITLLCGHKHDSPVAEWRFNGARDIPWGFFTDQGHLDLPNLQPSAAGNYSCHSQSGGVLAALRLRVGSPPRPPAVSCRASDYYNFSCYWRPGGETFLPSRYIASYRSNNHVSGICLQEAARPNACSVRESQPWSTYQINITEENPLGAAVRILVFTVQSIVKPDPPEKVTAEPVPYAPRRLRVSWLYPSTWPQEPQFQLRFRLQYRPVLYQYWSVVETANLTDVITDAFAGVEHVIQVSARDFLDAGNWSEWSPEVRATPWAAKEASGLPTAASDGTTTEDFGSEPEEPTDQNDPLEKEAVMISLGIFAFVVLVLFLVIGVLIWVRVGRSKESGKKAGFLSTIHMKALPKSQIL